MKCHKCEKIKSDDAFDLRWLHSPKPKCFACESEWRKKVSHLRRFCAYHKEQISLALFPAFGSGNTCLDCEQKKNQGIRYCRVCKKEYKGTSYLCVDCSQKEKQLKGIVTRHCKKCNAVLKSSQKTFCSDCRAAYIQPKPKVLPQIITSKMATPEQIAVYAKYCEIGYDLSTNINNNKKS